MALTFEAPVGYRMPEGVEVGDEFEEVCTLKFTGDGKRIAVLAVDGNTISEDARKERKKPVSMMEMGQQMERDDQMG